MDTTSNYFILNTVSLSTHDSVLIVVEKKSKQIKTTLGLDQTIELKTYSFFDVVALGNYCHEVEGKRIWCFMNSKKDLRFTESMGNEIFIND